MRNITFKPQAYSDYIDWLKIDRKMFDKITRLIREAAKDPAKGTGKPEKLKFELSGYWSRRINNEHRLVYKATSDVLEIISCRYHYR